MEQPLLEIARFSVYEDDRVALQGPTGSGKSSLLRAIAILDPWDSGELCFRSQRITASAVTAFRREVIYIPQRPALIPGTVRDNLRLPYRVGMGQEVFDEARAVTMLNQLGRSASFLQQPSDALSGGERQFVALVRAIQLEPQVLLLDEPTASLDAEATSKLEAAVMAWHSATNQDAAGRAFVIASHHAEQIERLTDRTITISAGSIQGDGLHV
jgi:putative ABC transport system ATP-binding protein